MCEKFKEFSLGGESDLTEKKSRFFVWLGYLYIILPVLIFFAGWCNLQTAIVGFVVILISAFFLFRNAPELWIPSTRKEKFLLAVIFVISLIWVYSSGIGALVFQNPDHSCRNPIFELLVQESWPVESVDNPAVLTYYIGFWLASAVIGKLTHSVQIGYYSQILWAASGVFLFFYYVLATLNKKVLWTVVLFIFFSGLDILGEILLYGTHSTAFMISSHLDCWYRKMQFSSFTTQLYWVFNQAVPAWIITMLFYHQKNNKNIVFIYSCMFLHSTLPAIGILPFAIYCGLRNNNIKNAIKSALTFENIVGGGVITLVTCFYLSNNIFGRKFGFSSIGFSDWIFFFLEAGIFIFCICEYNRKNILIYLVTLMLLFYPMIKIGYGIDFCMRATIPAQVLLYLLVVKTFDSGEILKNKKILTILMTAILIGAFTPFHEMVRTYTQTLRGITKIEANLRFETFYGWKKDNLFLKYFGKNKD